MSILYKDGVSCLIDHYELISRIYQSVQTVDHKVKSLAISQKLFCIKEIKRNIDNKRKHNSDNILKETQMVKQMHNKFLQQIPTQITADIRQKYDVCETADVRVLAGKLFETTVFNHSGLSGGNNSILAVKCKIQNEDFLIPSKSRFYCGCVKEQCGRLAGNKYAIVIADPPWWNKYIRRLKGANEKLSYSMMYNEDIASIPVKDLLSENCLVAVWCTNAPSNVAAVKDLIFPSWGVEYLTTWHWLKVTIDMKPMCDFSTGNKKQPYERIMIGKVGKVIDVPENLLVVSIPSALHSHKPPLKDLLTPYIEDGDPQTLELFARYLLPNTTSVGYEPLKWQHISLYDIT